MADMELFRKEHARLQTVVTGSMTPLYRRMRRAAGYVFRCCGWGSSAVASTDVMYTDAVLFAASLAREGVPVIAGGPYVENGQGRGIQHALHEGACSVHPAMSVGCELVIPAWEFSEAKQYGQSLRCHDFGSRLTTMSVLASVYVCFPRFGFGTDFERSYYTQMVHLIYSLTASDLPEDVFMGPLSLQLGCVPRLVLIGDSYEYVQDMVSEMRRQKSISAESGGDDAYVFVRDTDEALMAVRNERIRWTNTLIRAGVTPDVPPEGMPPGHS